MENQKKYLRVKDIMEAAVKKAQEDPLFQEAEKECVLDYHQLCFTTRFDEVKLCSFNVIGHPEYGGSEGIYGKFSSLASGFLSIPITALKGQRLHA